MSHEITASDNVVLNRIPAWHGLGTVVQDAPTVDAALGLAGLSWEIEQAPLSATREISAGDYSRTPVTTHVANIRKDTGAVLGVVTKGYKPVQNRELGEFILAVADANKDLVRIESAGSIQGGKKVWFLAQTTTMITVGKNDEIKPYVLFSNAHDGTAALRVTPTAVRVVCKNTYDATMREADQAEAHGKALSIRHSGDLNTKLAAARNVILANINCLNGFEKKVQRMAAVKFGPDMADVTGQATAEGQLLAFFTCVYMAAVGKVPTKIQTPEDERANARAQEIVGQWLANFHGERQNLPGISGTVWAGLNAITEWADHRDVRGSGKAGAEAAKNAADAKVYRNLWGTGAAMKNIAVGAAMKLTMAAGG